MTLFEVHDNVRVSARSCGNKIEMFALLMSGIQPRKYLRTSIKALAAGHLTSGSFSSSPIDPRYEPYLGTVTSSIAASFIQFFNDKFLNMETKRKSEI